MEVWELVLVLKCTYYVVSKSRSDYLLGVTRPDVPPLARDSDACDGGEVWAGVFDEREEGLEVEEVGNGGKRVSLDQSVAGVGGVRVNVAVDLEPSLGVGVHAPEYVAELWMDIHLRHDFMKECPVHARIGVVLVTEDQESWGISVVKIGNKVLNHLDVLANVSAILEGSLEVCDQVGEEGANGDYKGFSKDAEEDAGNAYGPVVLNVVALTFFFVNETDDASSHAVRHLAIWVT